MKGDVDHVERAAHFCADVFSQPLQDFAKRSVAAVTEDVPVNLDPHVCSPRYRGVRKRNLRIPAVVATLVREQVKADMFGEMACFQREIATSERREKAAPALQPPPLPCRYHRCDTDELWMRL